jgi:DNA-binding CsgD family transcriptional regulator
VAEGKTSKQIADMLFISRRTVEHHRASISKKVKAKNVADLIKYAVRNGYASVT